MSLKEDFENGTLRVDASKSAAEQKYDPTCVLINIVGQEHLCPGVEMIKGLGTPDEGAAPQFGLKMRINENGAPTVCDKEGVGHVDFKECLKTGATVEMEISLHECIDGQLTDKPKDAVAILAEVFKLTDDFEPGQVKVRYITLSIVGWREPLDFEPPTVALPKAPFQEASK